jgi:hypothetical protein
MPPKKTVGTSSTAPTNPSVLVTPLNKSTAGQITNEGNVTDAAVGSMLQETSVLPFCPPARKDFIEFKCPFIGGPFIEQATNGLCYGQEKSVISSTQVLKVQKEKCHPKKTWINVTLEDYN